MRCPDSQLLSGLAIECLRRRSANKYLPFHQTGLQVSRVEHYLFFPCIRQDLEAYYHLSIIAYTSDLRLRGAAILIFFQLFEVLSAILQFCLICFETDIVRLLFPANNTSTVEIFSTEISSSRCAYYNQWTTASLQQYGVPYVLRSHSDSSSH